MFNINLRKGDYSRRSGKGEVSAGETSAVVMYTYMINRE
jgi:hypothetical protein